MKQLTPFHSEKSELQFPFQPLRDLVFIYPVPPPKKLGEQQLIHIPEEFRKKHHDGAGIILAIGSGHTTDKGKSYPAPSELKAGVKVLYDIGVPWGMFLEGQDKKRYYIILCGTADIFGVVD